MMLHSQTHATHAMDAYKYWALPPLLLLLFLFLKQFNWDQSPALSTFSDSLAVFACPL